MKISKLLLIGAIIAGFAGIAAARTKPAAPARKASKETAAVPAISSVNEVYVAGSTAYRGAVTKAIEDVLDTSGGGFSFAWDGGSSGKPVYGAGEAVFSGTYGGVPTVVHTYWTGSAAGCIDLSVPNQITKWMADNVSMAPGIAPTNGTNGYTGGINLHGTTYGTVTAYPNVAMSDSFFDSVAKSVATAPGNGTAFKNAILNAGLTEAGAAGESVVGILPFVWVAGVQSTGSAPFTNITQEAASQLCTAGAISLDALGITSDTNDYAFLIGRNEDSGTRIAAQAESQIASSVPAASFGRPMTQYYVVFNGSPSTDGSFPADDTYANAAATPLGNTQTGGNGTTVLDFGLWPSDAPVNTETAINWNSQGHSGQIGGGDVAAVLTSSNGLTLSGTSIDGGAGLPDNFVSGASKAYFVGYLGLADAAGIPGVTSAATGNPAVSLSYNGVPFSATAILNGSYDFWSFEHMYYITNSAAANYIGAGGAGTVKAFADAVCDKLFALDAQTDSSGNTDPNTPPNPKAGGILFNSSAHFTRTREGYPITPLF